jgi:hypothetical protein
VGGCAYTEKYWTRESLLVNSWRGNTGIYQDLWPVAPFLLTPLNVCIDVAMFLVINPLVELGEGGAFTGAAEAVAEQERQEQERQWALADAQARMAGAEPYDRQKAAEQRATESAQLRAELEDKRLRAKLKREREERARSRQQKAEEKRERLNRQLDQELDDMEDELQQLQIDMIQANNRAEDLPGTELSALRTRLHRLRQELADNARRRAEAGLESFSPDEELG